MTDNMKMIIQAVLQGNDWSVDNAIETILKSDKADKDKVFRRRMAELLEKRKENRNTVPPNCSSFVVFEQESEIDISHYLITERDAVFLDKMKKRYMVSQKLFEMGIQSMNSAILYGEPGTGKTTFGRLAAKSLHLPFIYLNMSYLVDSLLGKTQKNITNVFQFVKNRKCVFMLDELDAICSKRSISNNDVAEMQRVTISVMQELDRMGNGSIVLGATNRLDMIDEAIISRLGNKHEVLRFSEDERKQYVLNYMEDVGIEIKYNDAKGLYLSDCTQRELNRRVITYISDFVYQEMFSSAE